jgi:hypothetical protein
MRRKNADVEAEYNAVTCVAVYMQLMTFSQKGIDKLRNHQEHIKMRNPEGEFLPSEGFDDGGCLSLLFREVAHVFLFSVDVVQGAFHQVQRTCGSRQDLAACAIRRPQKLVGSDGV